MTNKSLYLVPILLLCGCARTPSYIDTTCDIIKPIMINKYDIISDETLRSIYELNMLLEKKCHFK